MENAIIVALVSLIFSIISIIFMFMRFGINITQEFTERPDVLDRRDKIQQSLRRQLIEEWNELKLNYMPDQEIGEEELDAFFNFGLNAFICKLPTFIVNDISDLTQGMLSNFFFIVIGIIGTALSYYLYSIEMPFITNEMKSAILGITFLISILIVYSNIRDMRNMIPKIIKTRQAFFRLTEETTLEDARDTWDLLSEKDLI